MRADQSDFVTASLPASLHPVASRCALFLLFFPNTKLLPKPIQSEAKIYFPLSKAFSAVFFVVLLLMCRCHPVLIKLQLPRNRQTSLETARPVGVSCISSSVSSVAFKGC